MTERDTVGEIVTDGGVDNDELRGSQPTAVDLFCGAGGAGLGLHQAGFDVVAGVDTNEAALRTYNENLSGDPVLHDLSELDPSVLPTEDIDFVHGSPPCQGFSSAKGNRDESDERNQLVFRFVEWVEELQPKAVTMENVPGMATISSTMMDKITGAFRRAGYHAKWKKLNAADYGVPQTRERIFFVALRDDLPTPTRWFPRPTHAETETTTLDGRTLLEWPTVRDAIGDLAPVAVANGITSQQNESHQKAGRRPMHSVDALARTIRCGTTPQLRAEGVGVANHVKTDHSEEAKATMSAWELGFTGDSVTSRRLHPDAPAGSITCSSATPPVHYQGPAPNHDPEPLSDAAKEYLGPTQLSKHRPNEPDEPSRTIPANIHKGVPYGLVRAPDDVADAPSCTVTSRGRLRERGHHESISDDDVRRLTVREAARLQSFPDTHIFVGTKTAQLKQVGNAVPPLLQYRLASHLRNEVFN